MATPEIELRDATRGRPPMREDWVVYYDGKCYGFIYRCDKPAGYAVGIGHPGLEVEFDNVAQNKQTAVEFAQKHIAMILARG
ncbi:hypothetical protein ACFQAT_13445 [Undibacterium arcticum]|uniref:Uncharacterized protein n=1 Tax=Undibacterium arcticum TaxID=1762892 RepID=A0ABV7F9A8_9BURK